MNEKTNTPNITVLGPITPAPEQARGHSLRYNNLDQAVEMHAPFLRERTSRFWDAPEGSLEEMEAAKQLAIQYMLMGSVALQGAASEDSKHLWSSRYTQATSELYGSPDAELARQLWAKAENGQEVEVQFGEAAEALNRYLDETYAPVYEALNLHSAVTVVEPSEIADRFEAALEVLAEGYDPAWGDWSVDRNMEKDSLSVGGKNNIIVGMRRAAMDVKKLKGLFAHEVLVHGLRALNGAKRSEKLGRGLPDYLDVEEGLGVFVEYASSGVVPEKNLDRYLDISFAMGMIDGEEHTRAELIDRARARATSRNMSAEIKKTSEDIEKEVYAHVNRIYRGSLGDEHVGIFTKDSSYHKGFLEAGAYIQSQLDNGMRISEVMDYLMQGKFDPTNELHCRYMDSIDTEGDK